MSYGWDRGRVKTTPGRPSIRYSDLRRAFGNSRLPSQVRAMRKRQLIQIIDDRELHDAVIELKDRRTRTDTGA